MQETPVWFLGQEEPLEQGEATHSSILGLPLWLSWWRISLQCGRPGFDPWVGKIPWRRERLPTPIFWPGEFHGVYSPWGHKELDTTFMLLHFRVALVVKTCLPVQETQETRIQSLRLEDPLEKGTATNSSILACRIPWTKEPGGLQSMGSQRVGHDWSNLACTHTEVRDLNRWCFSNCGSWRWLTGWNKS